MTHALTALTPDNSQSGSNQGSRRAMPATDAADAGIWVSSEAPEMVMTQDTDMRRSGVAGESLEDT